MTTPLDTLFSPFSLKNLSLENRVVMAPMTRSFSPGGVPTEDVAQYYRRRAEGGVGLIITEGTTVDHAVASMDPDNIPWFHANGPLAGWQKVVDEVHAAGGKIMPQLWHVGMMRNPAKTPAPQIPSAGPSGVLKPGKKIAGPMSETEIEQVIEAFVDGAVEARRIGFDGVEFHGAHGYLLDQFFWGATNLREDKWGGSLPERTRFVTEILKRTRQRVGPDFPLVLRYSQWKQQDYTQRLANTPQELEAFLAPLAEAGVDILHCSTRRFWEPEFEGSDMNLAGWTKKLTGLPSITVGSVGLDSDFIGAMTTGAGAKTRNIDDLLRRLSDGEFDLVAVGRALLTDPEWANKIRHGHHDALQPFHTDALAKLA